MDIGNYVRHNEGPSVARFDAYEMVMRWHDR